MYVDSGKEERTTVPLREGDEQCNWLVKRNPEIRKDGGFGFGQKDIDRVNKKFTCSVWGEQRGFQSPRDRMVQLGIPCMTILVSCIERVTKP